MSRPLKRPATAAIRRAVKGRDLTDQQQVYLDFAFILAGRLDDAGPNTGLVAIATLNRELTRLVQLVLGEADDTAGRSLIAEIFSPRTP